MPGARPLLEFGTFHLLRKQFAANRMTNILVCVEGFLRAVLHAPVSFVRKRLAAVAAAAVCGRDLAAALAAVVYHAIGALVCEISYYVLGMIFSNVPALIAIRAQLLLMTFREEAAYRCACASVCASRTVRMLFCTSALSPWSLRDVALGKSLPATSSDQFQISEASL